MESTKILEISFFCLYLLIHIINDVVRITEYSFNCLDFILRYKESKTDEQNNIYIFVGLGIIGRVESKDIQG